MLYEVITQLKVAREFAGSEVGPMKALPFPGPSAEHGGIFSLRLVCAGSRSAFLFVGIRLRSGRLARRPLFGGNEFEPPMDPIADVPQKESRALLLV